MSTSRTITGFLSSLIVLLAFGVAVAEQAPRVDVVAWLQEDGELSLDSHGQSDAPERDLRVTVWHGKEDEEVYRRGEDLDLYFRGNKDAYAVAYRIDADGYVEVLWPLNRYDDGFVYGGRTYSLPPDGLGLNLEASRSKGVEYVEVILSEYPFDLRDLAIDFAFDRGETATHDYKVAGDPFLAVNDINYAITGLEEDQDYIVTDWAHVYIEDKVDYPRYTCTQCHTGDEGRTYQPYAESCTQVNVYYDWDWYSRWHVRFGYYPLFYDPPFYYWDIVYARPYYFHYYPVYYHWPRYHVYTRPYPVYSWHTHRNYRGDHVVRTRRGVIRDSRLYTVNRSSTRRRDVVRTDPPSIRGNAQRVGSSQRPVTIERDRLVRNSPPARNRSAEAIQVRRSRDGQTRTPGIQTSRGSVQRTRNQTIRSLGTNQGPRDRTIRNSDTRGRTWTKPVIRNADPSQRSTRSTDVRKPRSTRPRQDVKSPRAAPTQRDRSRATVKPRDNRSSNKPKSVKPRSTNRSNKPKSVKPRSTNRSNKPKSVKPRSTNRSKPKSVKPRSTNRGGGGKKAVKPRSGKSGGGGQAVSPRSTNRSARSKSKSVKPRSTHRRAPSKSVQPRSAQSSSKRSPAVKRSAPSSRTKASSATRSRSSSSRSRSSRGRGG